MRRVARLVLGGVLGLALSGCSASPPPPGPAEPSDAVEEPRTAPAVADDGAQAPAEAEAVVAAKAEEPETPAVAEAPAGPPPSHEDPWLRGLLDANAKTFRRLLADPERYRWQILVTVIAPKGSKGPPMVEHGFRVDAEYVYPASAIKTFAAVGALRVLQDLKAQGHPVGLHTPMAYCDGNRTKCTIASDESNLDGGTITVGHEIRKMQLVSNNISFNRLYELVGHRELNEMMWSLGFPSLRVQHRMYGVQDPVAQRATPRVELRPAGKKAVVIPAKQSDLEMPPLPYPDLGLGVAYIDDATHSRVDEPLDFTSKNYVSIRDLHRLALAIARPDLPGVPDLGLTEEHRKHLIASMSDNPAKSTNPVYTDVGEGLAYKTMIGGMLEVLPLERILYVGKAGRAYGFHLDNAYVEDTKTGRAMVITAVAYANANGVLNDNVYEYDKVTRPFLREIGGVLAKAVFVDGGGL